MWEETKNGLKRIGNAFVFFVVKVVIAAIFVAADLGLEKLASLVLEHGTAAFDIVEFVLDVTFVGSAVVISAAGAFVVAVEVILSSKDYLKRRLKDDRGQERDS